MRLPLKSQRAEANNPRLFVVDSGEKAATAEKMFRSVKAAALDVESDGKPQVWLSRAVTAQASWDEHDVFVLEEYLPCLKPAVERESFTAHFYSAKGDMWWLENAGLKMKCQIKDSMVSDYLMNENVKIGKGAGAGSIEESLKSRYAQEFQTTPRNVWKKEFPKTPEGARSVIERGDLQQLIAYGVADSRETWEFAHLMENRLSKLEWMNDESMLERFNTIDAPFTKVLYKMERRGVRIDLELLDELHVSARKVIDQLRHDFYKEMRAIEGTDEFTEKAMNSPKQLQKLFYDVLNAPKQYKLEKAKGGRKAVKKLTTDEEALNALSKLGFKLPSLLKEFRGIDKLFGTYIEGLREFIDGRGRVHTDFQQAFTATGRLSSRHPNMQNWPRPGSDRLGIRSLLIPSLGMILIGGDYKQIETRLMAHLSKDRAMIAACLASDIYQEMGSQMFGHPIEKNSDERQAAKAIVLGIGFGKQANSIAEDLGISKSKAEAFFKMYFKKFPDFEAYIDKHIAKCRRNGYVRTLGGRYRRLPDIRSREWYRAARAERQTVNSTVQGSAAEIVCTAMQKVDDAGICEEHGAHMLLSVHDELLFECPKDESQAFSKKVQDLMEHPFDRDLRVPLDVDMYRAMDWGSAK